MSRSGNPTLGTEHGSFVVGTTTCYGHEQLVETVKSLRMSQNFIKDFRVIVVADSVKLTEAIIADLTTLKVEIIENPTESSAFAKQLQILEMVNEEYIILTQDDVLFHPLTISKVLEELTKEGVTFVGVKNQPIKPASALEGGISIATTLCNSIARHFNGGDNYLACLGRLMAFRTDFLKKMHVEIDSVSLDAYLYFENKRIGGKYVCLWDYPLYFRAPQNILEHLRKSSRFQYSQDELISYRRFGDLRSEYKLPLVAIIRGTIDEFFKNPFYLAIYVFIFFYTRLFKRSLNKSLIANWEVDESTKDIKLNYLQTR